MNKVILIGRLTRNPEVRYSAGDNSMAIARYTLAVDRRQARNNNNEATADFINCVAFGKNAEFAEKYLQRGTKIAVVGRIQTGSYTNREGQKVYTTDVVVEEVEFAESKAASENSNNSSGNSRNAAENNRGNYGNASANRAPQPDNGFMHIPEGFDDELPFN